MHFSGRLLYALTCKIPVYWDPWGSLSPYLNKIPFAGRGQWKVWSDSFLRLTIFLNAGVHLVCPWVATITSTFHCLTAVPCSYFQFGFACKLCMDTAEKCSELTVEITLEGDTRHFQQTKRGHIMHVPGLYLYSGSLLEYICMIYSSNNSIYLIPALYVAP